MSGDAKKAAFLGMPGYAQVTGGAARGFWLATGGGLDVWRAYQSSSLLTLNMNILWCDALNRAHAGKAVDYFAMQHADVEPEDHWLDKLVGEMEARGLDVLGCVIPLKDPRGLTSTAVAHETGDPYRIKYRLAMAEVFRLPETFTSEDVGGPLLINTGLWVCRFREEWARQVRFRINDELGWCEPLGKYVPRNESEDWYVSRLFHELGLKVGVTRKVELAHQGLMGFANARPWGTYEFDRSALAAPAELPGAAKGAAFPHDVAGWLSEAEGRELARLAAGKMVLEIGSYCGRSTICLASAARGVAAVDTFDGRGTPLEGDTEPLFRRNIARYGVADRVSVYRGESAAVLPNLPPAYELVFVDGSHDRESVARDAGLARGVLRPGGLIAFHDYKNGRDPGVEAAVDEFLAAGAELVNRVDSLAVVRPPEVVKPLGV